MSESSYRIPRMALATLVLGGACGDDAREGDIDEARVDRTVTRFCSQATECGWNEEDEDACNENVREMLDALLMRDERTCVAAYLTLYDCYTRLACEEQGCEEEDAEKTEACFE